MDIGKRAFINRELSWIEFNQRVLDEASNESVPVLERLNFLAITASNLDEFFMVRVGGLQMMTAEGLRRPDPTGLTPAQQLEKIGRRCRRMAADQYRCWKGIERNLRAAGIRLIGAGDLTPVQAQHVEQVFQNEILSVIAPIALREGVESPAVQNLGLYLAVRLRGREAKSDVFALVPLGRTVARFVSLPTESGRALIAVEEIIRTRADRLFPGHHVVEVVPFRVTRNADISVREDLAADFMAEMEAVLDRRKEGHSVRLEIGAGASHVLLRKLIGLIAVDPLDVYEAPGPLELSGMRKLIPADGFARERYPSWPPQASPQLKAGRGIFDELKAHDVLLIHPYDSFDPVLRLLDEASRDPNVLAIKQTLYRAGPDSAVIASLIRAAERGQYVTVIVELKARFDEERNIEWARELEKAGAQVIYGVRGLKTHAKALMVVRREAGGIVRYLQFGTGNYNERTTRLYTDISYLTADPVLGADASLFFHTVTGYSEPQRFGKLIAAPLGLRETLLSLIDNEAERRRQGQPALIRAKMNSLADPEIVRALCRASRAGVKIELNVRGICCLRPGVRGVSENISVVSIVDRYLEHARVFYFHQGGKKSVYIGSADLMPRNLDRRIELLVPVEDAACRRRVIALLDACLADTVKGRELRSSGSYVSRAGAGKRRVRCQELLYRRAREAVVAARKSRGTVFEPHRSPNAE
jgi:polyphosphate kinase